jgi:hypothetical protein
VGARVGADYPYLRGNAGRSLGNEVETYRLQSHGGLELTANGRHFRAQGFTQCLCSNHSSLRLDMGHTLMRCPLLPYS